LGVSDNQRGVSDFSVRRLSVVSTIVACVVAPAVLSLGCGSGPASSDRRDETTPATGLYHPDQGWHASTRAGYYHRSQGSELMPMTWFLALEHGTAPGRFVERLRDFGFVESDAPSSENPHGLPVGFTAARNDETAALYNDNHWVGLTCSACHNGEIAVQGKRIRIDGGASLIDFYAFQKELLAAVETTLSDEPRFNRFAAAVASTPAESMRGPLTKFSRNFAARLARTPEYQVNGVTSPGGPGRVDGLGTPVNETLCKLAELGDPALRRMIENPQNCAGGQPSTSYPQLWGVPHQEYVQWAGNVHSSLGRNVGEVNGVFGTNWVDRGPLGLPRFRTSADLHASHEIEKWLTELRPPSWRAMARDGMVPPLREDLVQKGAGLFAERCQRCHPVQPEFTSPDIAGYSYWKINVTPVKEIGTDPGALEVANARTAILPAILAVPYRVQFGRGSIGPNRTVSASQYRAFVIQGHIASALALKRVRLDEAIRLTECRDTRQQTIVGYKGRSLEGVVFTAPYLHNGSVPTLDDLLQPESARPKSFFVGCRDYDTERLGYKCEAASDRAFLLDTTLPGNSNAGHTYGTDVGADGRAALLEFMKSLEQPKPAPRPKIGICTGDAPRPIQ
jgi:hypothetical protein